ncbi:5236_t:CDS:2 [Gigaspora margarita]|uniref:5236_t:CDS:1 n=1 Tax=Gigaspora margarita TaxID=4874 RepID=A0ABN7V9J5_GIGMA|nr:5236_t:CDS:2 [Gigaspora margarita]
MDSSTLADQDNFGEVKSVSSLKSKFEKMKQQPSQTSGLASRFNVNEDNKQHSRNISLPNTVTVNQQPKRQLQKGSAAALSSRESSACSTDVESDDPLNKDGLKQSLIPPSSTKPVSSFSKKKSTKFLLDDDPFDDSQEINPFADDNEYANEIISESPPSDKGLGNRHTHRTTVTPNKPPRKPVRADNTQSSINNSKNLCRYTDDDDFKYKPPPLPSRPSVQITKKSSPPPLPPNRPVLPHRMTTDDDDSNNKARRKSSNLKAKVSRSNSDPEHIDPVLKDSQSDDERPDVSHINRRPPNFKGFREISCKSSTRAFAIGGDHVITDSGHTRVWSLLSGENINTISHDDSKVTCLCWRPANRMEDVGRYLWCGGLDGHLFAIDIRSEDKYFEMTRKAHSSSVNFILCYESQKMTQLWTLDTDGKLLIWSEGDDGIISLKSTPEPFRVAPNQTCAIIVGHYLWTAAEKNIEIFNPHNKYELNVKKISFGTEIGNITCMTQTNNSSLVYVGHEDGRISVWDVKSYNRIALVHASDYSITSILGVNDYLWVGFKTGMIYIYDVTKRPWVTIKDWKAHKSPIIDMQLDEAGLWRVGRLQVASCSSEGSIISWDGLMEQDWLADKMSLREKTYCNYRDIKILICSWNIGACKPGDLEKSSDGIKFMRSWLASTELPDIIVIGFQEIFDLKSKKMNAKTMLTSKKKLKTKVEENLEKRSQEWRDKLAKMVEHASNGDKYEVLSTGNLFGLFSCFFVKKTEKEYIRDVHTAMHKTGLGGYNGNKGSIATRFIYDDSSMCFVNCHLAAGQKETLARNKDVANILENTTFPICFRESWNDYENVFTHGGDGTMVSDHEICFLSGDLNYRIDSQRDVVLKAIAKKNYDSLLAHDQLIKQRKTNPSFRLRSFLEGEPRFAPTYKYNPGEDEYDTSEKRRTPAWCDRILYRGPRMIQEHYVRYECKVSDHRPISSAFRLKIKAIDRDKQSDAKDKVMKEWKDTVEKEKLKLMAKWLHGRGFEYEMTSNVLNEVRGNLRKAFEVLNKNHGKSYRKERKKK